MSGGAPGLRVVVIGSSGSGKTSLAAALAAQHGIPHIELDALHWAENWQARPVETFRALVQEAAAAPNWIADGNYSAVREQLWQRATHIVWLDYSRFTITRRIWWRTLSRLVTREPLWAGNREDWRTTFFSRESILVWSWQGVTKNRVRYRELQASGAYPHLQWLVLRHPREAQALPLRPLDRKPA